MMNEYEKQAVDFCNKWEIEIKWMFVGVGVNSEWCDNKKRNHWHWIITKDGKATQGEFWDSVVNTQKTYQDPNKRNNPNNPRAYDLFACLEKYGYDSFEDFCCEFGYDENSRKTYNTYEAVKKEYNGLVNVFGNNEELWEEFREIR